MGLLDRLFGSRSASVKVSGSEPQPKKKKESETFFLDPDSSSTLGNVDYMRRSNTIRRTFPGNADSPGQKEMVQKVASMEAALEKMTPGLAGTGTGSGQTSSSGGGVPKPVKKTFAQQIPSAVLEQRLKGAAVKGVNESSAAAANKPEAQAGTGEQPAITQQPQKPGATDAFRSWARDIST